MKADVNIVDMKDHTQLDLAQGHRHVFKIGCGTRGSNIQCSAISSNGRWFACAAPDSGLKLFRLQHRNLARSSVSGGDGADLDEDEFVTRVKVASSVVSKDMQIQNMLFSGDSQQLLLVLSDCRLLFVDLPFEKNHTISPQSPMVQRAGEIDARLRLDDGSGTTLARTASRIKYIDWTVDSRWIAVAHHTNRVVVYPHPNKVCVDVESRRST